eukprot:g14569.t1
MGYIFPLLTCDEIVQVLRNSDKFPDVNADVLQKPQNYVTVNVSEQYYDVNSEKNVRHGGVTVGGGNASSSTSNQPFSHQLGHNLNLPYGGHANAGHHQHGANQPIGILDIYIAFWNFISGTDDIRRMPWHEPVAVSDALDHAPAHVAALGLSPCRYPQPDPKRLRRNLSALINFCRFKEDESQSEHEHQRIVEDLELKINIFCLSKKIASSAEQLRGLKDNVEKQEAELAQERQAVARYDAEEKAIKAEMERLNIFAIEQAMDDAKRDTTATTERIENGAGDIKMLEDATFTLRKGVITDMDPGKLVDEVNRLREKSRTKQSRIATLTQSVEKLQEETQRAESGTSRCTLFLDRVREHVDFVERCQRQETELGQLETTLEENRAEFATSEQEQQNIKDKLIGLTASIEQLGFHKQKEKEALQTELRALEEEIGRAAGVLEQEQKAVRENAEVNDVEQKLEDLQKMVAEKRNESEDWKKKLEEAGRLYEEELRIGMLAF